MMFRENVFFDESDRHDLPNENNLEPMVSKKYLQGGR
jgi:hypothetical protein